METSRVKLKIGVHEFEAEGPADVVAAQLEVWKQLVAVSPNLNQVAQGSQMLQVGGDGARNGKATVTPEDESELGRVFLVDERKDLLTLRVHPRGETREADAILLLVYGYKALKQLDEVLVTKLMESLKVSGLSITRLDRTVKPHLDSGYLLKAGRAKGGKYRLTNTGVQAAKRLASAIVSTMA